VGDKVPSKEAAAILLIFFAIQFARRGIVMGENDHLLDTYWD
jgi:hypothetical protein